ncbi:MAG TPA: adenylate/guanylate cyclase domain-containing protein, partial [Candidatus Baltobacteraceae bacterium]|nr:adenylate/guanylate cyclase domain-containing protein [Candidatus Baltobacteraceae bacterium]
MAPRDLRTVLFTDIVGSTEQASRLGDRAWGELLARHQALVRQALRATGGHEVDTAGDGFFATFGRPTAALACAGQIVAAVLIGVTLAGGGARPSATPTSVAGASASASPSASSSPAATGFPVCGLCYGPPLTPGRYVATELPGTPTFTIADDGWELYWSIGAVLTLDRVSSPSDRVSIVWFDALPADTDVCSLHDWVDLGRNPEAEFLAWAQANKALQLSTGIPRRFGDLAATQFDVSVVDKYACQYMAPHAISLGALGPNLNVGERLRLEVSSREGQLILILIEATSATEFLDTFDPFAEQVL